MDNIHNPYLSIAITLSIIIVFAILLTFVKKLRLKPQRIYKPKGPCLLSAGETRFFKALEQSVSEELYICPKVRIADLVDVTLSERDKDFWKSFNKISQKHVDFVLCNHSDFAPRLVVELDGGSHYNKFRSQRDVFVDDVFKQANIPILHIKVTDTYTISQLKDQLNTALA